MGSATITDPSSTNLPTTPVTNDVNIVDDMLLDLVTTTNLTEDNSATTIVKYFTRRTLQEKLWSSIDYSILQSEGGGNPHSASPDNSSTVATTGLENLITFKTWIPIAVLDIRVQAHEIEGTFDSSNKWTLKLYFGNNRTSGATWTQKGGDIVLSSSSSPIVTLGAVGDITAANISSGINLVRLSAAKTGSPLCDLQVTLKIKALHTTV